MSGEAPRQFETTSAAKRFPGQEEGIGDGHLRHGKIFSDPGGRSKPESESPHKQDARQRWRTSPALKVRPQQLQSDWHPPLPLTQHISDTR